MSRTVDLPLWDGVMAASSAQIVYAWEVPPTPRPSPAVEPEPDLDSLEQLAAREIWRILPSRKPAAGDLEPLSTEWFQHLENKRYRRHGSWIPKLFELGRHGGESLVALGDGLGIEWSRFAEQGASISIVDSSSERLRLQRKLFSCRGHEASFLHAPLEQWPIASDRSDIVSAFFADPPRASLDVLVAETYRVLRPGGKVLMVLPAYNHSGVWQDRLFWWRRWTGATPAPTQGRFTKCNLRQAFDLFDDVRIYQRHLRRSELPYIWRWMMLPVAEKFMGRFLIVKAFKPLSASSATLHRAVA